MQDLSGMKFNKLTILKFDKKVNNKLYWKCICDCGTQKSYRGDLIKCGRRKSCGCIHSPNEIDYREKLKKRIIENSKIENECLVWKGAKNPGGQGLIKTKFGYKNIGRAAWYAWNGEVPKGLFILHSCDNRACGEISHLRLGTHKDNMNDMVKRNRAHKRPGEKHPISKFTDKEVIKIRNEYNKKEVTQSQLSIKYKVSLSCIHNIVRNKTWKHI